MLLRADTTKIDQKDLATMEKVYTCFKDKNSWARKSILAAASMGKFSSDRSIKEYAKRIWNIIPVPLDGKK